MDKLNGPEPDLASNEHQASDLVNQSSKEFYEAMLKERRRLNRGIPVPIVNESNSDSDWAAFESMFGIYDDTNQTE